MNELDKFWKNQLKLICWKRVPTKINFSDFSRGIVNWFDNGKLNIAYNLIEKNLNENRNKIAITFISSSNVSTSFTYKQLNIKVCMHTNLLKKLKLKKGKLVLIYLPQKEENIFFILACLKLGITFSVVFSGAGKVCLEKRITSLKPDLIITQEFMFRNGKKINLRSNLDEIKLPKKTKILTLFSNKKYCKNRNEFLYEKEMIGVNPYNCKYVFVNSNHPSFILYTSGSTGTPKGIVHSGGGYLLYLKWSFLEVFKPKKDEIILTTADIGWITGHSYMLFAPLSLGLHTIIVEDSPLYPNKNRILEIIEKHKVTCLYTTPTLIRNLIQYETLLNLKNFELDSIKKIGSVGECLDNSSKRWIKLNFKKNIIDTYWQTETGGIILENKPLPTIDFKIKKGGNLVIANSWPGHAIGLFNDRRNKKFKEIYFSKFENCYNTNDMAKKLNNTIKILGRSDDLINSSGHLISAFEIENQVTDIEEICECCIVSKKHKIKGEIIVLYCVLKNKIKVDKTELQKRITTKIIKNLGSYQKPGEINFVNSLPKTMSGKILRKEFRK